MVTVRLKRTSSDVVDAVLIFGSLLSTAVWGGPFLRDLIWLWSHAP